jgi:23S rRNA (uracil1939-C5)-methyltransferase
VKRRRPAPEADQRPAVGSEVVLEIAEMTQTGESIGRLGKYVIFLRDALPGERVRAIVTQSKTRFGRATLAEILRPSPYRVEPKCRHFGTCGRCSLQHMSYPQQLNYKLELVRAALAHAMPGRPMPIRPVLPMPDPWGTRNKAHFVLGEKQGKPFLAHFAAHSRELVAIEECPVHHPAGNVAAKAVVAALEKHRIRVFNEDLGRGTARHVVVRTSKTSGKSLALLVAAEKPSAATAIAGDAMSAEPRIAGMHLHVNPSPGPVVLGSEFLPIAGADRIVERAAGIDFQLSPTAFFQTNAEAADHLVKLVLDAVPKNAGDVLDLYCGIGLFSLPLARGGHRVLGVEQNPQAVEDAIATAERNGIHGCEFVAGKTEAILKRLPRERSFGAVVMDPPRNGAPEWVLRLIAHRIRPATIVDVSCDPGSLGRDLALLTSLGYAVREIQPLDMFPHTSQIETVAVLKRRSGASKSLK